MAAAVVGILDRDDWSANTDIIVVADDQQRRLTWVPRDLWSPRLHDRINSAVRRGGCAELIRTLGEFGFICDAGLVLRRSATESALASVAVTVPVPRRLDFWYPLAPTLPIESGRKRISFVPPAETLSGERIHQWLGARMMLDGRGWDFPRLERQQVFLQALIKQRFDFHKVLIDPEFLRTVGHPLSVLEQVTERWRMGTFGPTIFGTVEDSAGVLFHVGRARWAQFQVVRAWKRLIGRFAARSAA